MTIRIEEKEICPECDTLAEDLDLEACYECSSCGAEFSRSNSADGDSHRCPDCSKFGSKVTDNGCPDCGKEIETREFYICEDCEERYDDPTEAYECHSKDAGENMPQWLIDRLESERLQEEAARKVKQDKEKREKEFTSKYPIFSKIKAKEVPIILLVDFKYKPENLYGLLEEGEGEWEAKAGDTIYLMSINKDKEAAAVKPSTQFSYMHSAEIPLSDIQMTDLPTYHIGQIIPQIDLDSAGCFNKEYFQEAKIVDMSYDTYFDGHRWKYLVRDSKGSADNLLDCQIEFQSGQDKTKEYKHCCPMTTVHFGQTCSNCGKHFDDL